MKTKRIISLLLSLALAFGLLPMTALAVTTVNTIKITMTQPSVGKALPTDAKATTVSSYVTKMSWAGETDNGLMRGDRAYTATITVEIKPDKDAKYTADADKINVTVNGGSTGVSVSRVNDTTVRVRYTLAAGGVPAFAVGGFTISGLTAPRIGRALDKSVTTSSNSNVEVTSVEWSGELDADNHVQYDTPYTVTMNVKIKDGKNAVFSLGTVTPHIGSSDRNGTFTRLSDTTGVVTYTYPVISREERLTAGDRSRAETKATVSARSITMAQADAQVPLNNPITVVVNKDTVSWSSNLSGYLRDGNQVTTLSGEVIPANKNKVGGYNSTTLRITGVVYDMYIEEPTVSPGDIYRQPSFTDLPNVKEIWLSPNCDIEGFLRSIRGTVGMYDNTRNLFGTYDKVVLIPASLYPNGPTSYSPYCRVMLYDGDVYEAAKKGVSAARDWCTNHSYTAQISSWDRYMAAPTCTEAIKYYYSCARCGKIEYNPNHTFAPVVMLTQKPAEPTIHSYTVKSLADEHFVGLNAEGDRVYLLACEYCGKDKRYHDLNMTLAELRKSNASTTQASYELFMERARKWWAEGGSSHTSALKATVIRSVPGAFAVATSTYVTAKTSGWAKDDVNTASEQGLIDKSLLGDDYTKAITRLQFASVAVKMTEKMLGRSITAAPSGTFTDTDNAYALKAYAAGITAGTGDGSTFSPNDTLTRQQMATFLYRALQYVKANSDTRYSAYTSKLSEYSDAGQIESWAKDAMAFMNAFGLVNGSDGKLTPGASCPIEQSVIVALRSLDTPWLGWYQNVGDGGHYYTLGTNVKHLYGDRMWVTSVYFSDTNISFYGVCANPFGQTGKIDLDKKNVAPIRE